MHCNNLLPKKMLDIMIICLVLLGPSATAGSLPDFTSLVAKHSAAIVNISTTLKKGNQRRQMPSYDFPDLPDDSPFHDFLRKFFEGTPEGIMPDQRRSSLGSGFIISRDGYIITNAHVVKNADEIIVRLSDRREYTAEMIGTDQRSDIAVLKIEGQQLPVLELGDSGKLKVGEWVLAIGSPFGFDYSVTQGIISAIGRSLPNENYVPFIQTDVAINPGNSGGPLFNLRGEVIGVNSQIYSRTGGFMGMSFAIPANVVSDVYQQLKQQGRVSRGWLGVLIQDVTRDLAESFAMEKPHGALVAKVLADSPAKQAGLMVGDIIVNFNGDEVGLSSDLPPMVGSTQVGENIALQVIRRGQLIKLTVRIAELPTDEKIKLSSSRQYRDGIINALHVVVKKLTEAQRQELELEDHGVMVTEISPGPADKAGLRKGDVIMLMNNVKIRDPQHLEEVVDELPKNKSVPILVKRKSGPVFLALKLGDDGSS